MRPRVVLPDPDSPTMPTVCPARSSNETRSTAWSRPPSGWRKLWLTARTDTTTCSRSTATGWSTRSGGRALRRARRAWRLGVASSSELRVRVPWRAQDLADRPGLHDVSVAHHGDAVGDAGHDGQVVADEQQAGALALEAVEQVEDLGLDVHVERGRGLVRDEQGGTRDGRGGDERPLAQAARELVGVLADALRPDRASQGAPARR